MRIYKVTEEELESGLLKGQWTAGLRIGVRDQLLIKVEDEAKIVIKL